MKNVSLLTGRKKRGKKDMTDVTKMYVEINETYKEIRKAFGREKKEISKEYSHAIICILSEEIEDLFIKSTDMQKTKEKIIKIISNSVAADTIMEYLNFDEIMAAAKVRSDWNSALSRVAKGYMLSETISWGFTKNDIKELAKLHKSGKHREKIEDLLEDCNFHSLNCYFQAGDYSHLDA